VRTFIAIEIPEDTKKAIAEVQERLKASGAEASWTRPESIHLTLKFLGEVPEERVSTVMAALVRSGEVLHTFRLTVAGTGVFPNVKDPRVVWVGVSGDLDQLKVLQISVEEQMVRLGFPQDDRRFTPHLTLGRIKRFSSRQDWKQALETVRGVKLPGFEVSAISLVKSELKKTGAVYTEMGRVELR
jgi:RNA 2',3'-cyclic 3'-phosphodiesterase